MGYARPRYGLPWRVILCVKLYKGPNFELLRNPILGCLSSQGGPLLTHERCHAKLRRIHLCIYGIEENLYFKKNQ